MNNGGVLRAGVIGLGVGEQHINVYQAADGIEVSAICDQDPKRVEEIGESYGVAVRTADWRMVVDDPDIHVVSICSFDDAHAEQAVAALENGKHVFIEKPMCLIPNEAEAIRKTLEDHPDLKLSSNLPLRTCPRFEVLRTEMQDGALGTVYHLEADYIWGRPEKLIDGWRRKTPFYSVVLGASVHMIDLIIWLKGEKPVEVSGYGNRRAFENLDLGLNDFAVNVFRFADGTCAKVAAHGGAAHPHFHGLQVFGTEKTFHQTLDGAFWVGGHDPETGPRPETAEYPARSERGKVLTSFLAHIRDSANPPLVTAADAFATMDVAFAADRAISEGRTQKISRSL